MNQNQPLEPQTVTDSVERLWGFPLQSAGCPRCRQAFLVEAARLDSLCPNCAQGKLTPQPARLRSEPPEMLLPFHITQNQLLPIFKTFSDGIWLKPDDLNPIALMKRVQPFFWPMWLVDCNLTGAWQAEAGFEYQVKSAQESYQTGQWRSNEIVETRTRWEPRAGQITRTYKNTAAPALNLHKKLTRETGVYHFESASGFLSQRIQSIPLLIPDIHPEAAWPIARDKVEQLAAGECQQAAGAQRIQNFSLQANYQAQVWTQLLLPIFTTYYLDDEGAPVIVTINGQTGAIQGPRLASQRKGFRLAGILAGCAVVCLLIALLSFLLGAAIPPIAALGVIFGVLAFLLGVAAIIPAAWPSQWNQKQQRQHD